MALAKDRSPPCSFYGSYMLEGASPSPLQFPSLSNYPFEEDHYQKQLSLQGDDSDHCSTNTNIGKTQQGQVLVSHSPLSSSSSATSTNGGFAFHGVGSSYHQPEAEAHSLINFKAAAAATTTNNTATPNESYGGGGFMHTNGSFLSFQPQSCYNFGLPDENHFLEGTSPNQDQPHQVSGVQTASGGSSYRDAASEWLYGEGMVAVETAQESASLQQTSFNKKRPLMEEENIQTLKKQCNSTRKQPNKSKPSNSSKDPQSLAAKNRRERISDRLKILQDLVPNGSKVDMVTMLEKAIGYVKFLQLQVKVLATDEFWPEAGGKAPNITQVREAIDVILSSQRDKPSSPK